MPDILHLRPEPSVARERERMREEYEDAEREREWQASNPDDPRGCVVVTDDGRQIGITLTEAMTDKVNPWGVRWGGWLADERTFYVESGVVFDDATGERIGTLKRKGGK